MATFEKSKTVVTTRSYLKAIGSPNSFVLNGQIVPAGAIVDVGMQDASSLISRRKAVDATPAEVAAAGANIIVADSRSDRWADAA